MKIIIGQVNLLQFSVPAPHQTVILLRLTYTGTMIPKEFVMPTLPYGSSFVGRVASVLNPQDEDLLTGNVYLSKAGIYNYTLIFSKDGTDTEIESGQLNVYSERENRVVVQDNTFQTQKIVTGVDGPRGEKGEKGDKGDNGEVKVYRIENVVLDKDNWVLNTTTNLWEITINNLNINEDYIVNYTIYPQSINQALTANLLPNNDINNGSTTFYSVNQPTDDIMGELTIIGTQLI